MDRQELYNYYIRDNHSREDTAAYFGLSIGRLKKILKDSNIVKTHSLASRNNPKLGKSTKTKVKCVNNEGQVKYFSPGEVPESYKVVSDVMKSAVTREELVEAYIANNMSRAQVAEKYGLKEYQIKKILKDYGITKPKSLSVKLRNQTVNNHNSLVESMKRVDKDELIKYYIDENHSREECLEYFDVTMANLKAIISEYGIPNKERSAVSETYLQVMKKKYGVLTGFELSSKGHTKDSKPNLQFEKLLVEAGVDFDREFSLGNFRYDFRVGSTLIEINPTVTHNATWSPYSCGPKAPEYHKLKSKLANADGYRCIHIWDWDNASSIVALLQQRQTIVARKCEVREVTKPEAKDFINKNHIQGYAQDQIRIGLYYQDELISVMTFGKPRYNKHYEYELIRYCSIYNITGGAEKLYKSFIATYHPQSIISYCDYSKFDGSTYQKLGFSQKHISAPSIHWYNMKTKKHITDNLLRQRGFDQLFGTNYGKGASNEELMLAEGFVKVYDCGQATYIWLRG